MTWSMLPLDPAVFYCRAYRQLKCAAAYGDDMDGKELCNQPSQEGDSLKSVARAPFLPINTVKPHEADRASAS